MSELKTRGKWPLVIVAFMSLTLGYSPHAHLLQCSVQVASLVLFCSWAQAQAERAAAAQNNLVHLFSEEGLQEVALDCFTTERSRESDSEGETDLDEKSAIEEKETLFNTSTGTDIYTSLQKQSY